MFISQLTSCNGLKYNKIGQKSRGNNPIKPFQFQFTRVQPVFLISYFFYKQNMDSGNVHPQSQRRQKLFSPRFCSLEGWNER